MTGLCAFGFTYAAFIPSWLAECAPDVALSRAMWIPAGISFVLKFIFGLLGAWAFPLYDTVNSRPFPGSDNILNFLAGKDMPRLIQVLVFVWVACNVLPRIPATCIVVRYDLLTSNFPLCGRKGVHLLVRWLSLTRRPGSFVWAVIVPWFVTLFLFQSDSLAEFCNWSAIILQGLTNFMLPILLYKQSLEMYPK